MITRQPEGTRTGGQFSSHEYAESDVTLHFGVSPESRLSEQIAEDIAAFRGADDERRGRINAGMIMTTAMAAGRPVSYIRSLAEANLKLVKVGRTYNQNRELTDEWWTGREFQLRSVIQHIDVDSLRLVDA